jgi:15-cis-phytoene synthase
MASPDDDDAVCEALVKANDRAAWLSTLFMPPDKRKAVHALHAFAIEAARVRDVVSGPLPGEVRLQWWRDMLEGEARGSVSANPVAAALDRTIVRYGLPRAALTGMVDARIHDLYDDPHATVVDLEGYCGETSSALIRLDTLILADGSDPGPADAAGHAGVALGLVRLLQGIAPNAARGHVDIPGELMQRHGVEVADLLAGRDTPPIRNALAELRRLARHHLAAAERNLGAVPRACRPAFLPLALVRPLLDRMERRDDGPFGEVVALRPWQVPWHVWRASRHWLR